VARQKTRHIDDPRELGRRLHQLRVGARLTLRELAFPGCSPAYLSRIEHGERVPSLQLLVELGRRLGVDTDYLAWGVEANGDRRAQGGAPLHGVGQTFPLQTLTRALEQAQTSEEAVWSLAGIAQAAALAGDRARALGALKQALKLLAP
jgi:transcriptional regulator with XRE-family HTH domain